MHSYKQDGGMEGVLALLICLALITFLAIYNGNFETKISDGSSTINLEENNIDSGMDRE